MLDIPILPLSTSRNRYKTFSGRKANGEPDSYQAEIYMPYP